MSRIDLHCLLDASTEPERQMVTTRMPRLQAQELNAVPEAIHLADGTPPAPIDLSSEITRRLELVEPTAIAPALPPVRARHAVDDVTLIGVICSCSMIVCSALAFL